MIGVDEGCCLFVNTGDTLAMIPVDAVPATPVVGGGAANGGILGEVVAAVFAVDKTEG